MTGEAHVIRIRTFHSLLAACAVALVIELVPSPAGAQVTDTRTRRPLIVVDGVVLEGGSGVEQDAIIRIIQPAAIQSIEVLRGPAAAERFGAAAADGVIVIQLKPKFARDPRGERVVIPAPRDPKAPAPLFIVDGVTTPATVLHAITPQDIDRIEVIKGPAALEQFGERGRHGVIQITTRKRQLP
jgi:bla regulator protein blaR1